MREPTLLPGERTARSGLLTLGRGGSASVTSIVSAGRVIGLSSTRASGLMSTAGDWVRRSGKGNPMNGQLTGSDGGDVSRVLFDAWRSPQPATLRRVLTSTPVPGDLALRSRFDTLADLPRSMSSTADLSRERWDAQVELMRRGDQAVQRNDQSAGIEAFEALRASHRPGEHPLPLIESATGLGDLARQRDDLEESLAQYTTAMNLARDHGCDFGRVRTGLGLGYSQLNQASATSALVSFTTAADLARERDWRLDEANALLGVGECHHRLARPLHSLRSILDALRLFEGLSSSPGVANATVQLGELCRRLEWNEEARGWYSQAVRAIGDRDLPVAHANALDGLAEIEVELGDFVAARRHFAQAARRSIPGYPRGYAHALAGLARCSRAQGNYRTAMNRYSAARDAYESLLSYPAAAGSCSGIAQCAEVLDEPRLVIEARRDAVRLVEQTRAAQIRHADQAEYFDRFGHHYFAALGAALTHGNLGLFAAVFEAIAGRRLAGLLNTTTGADYAAMLAQMARLNAEARHTPVQDDNRSRRLARALGRISLSATLPDAARAAIDDVMAEAYQPFDISGAHELYSNAVAGRDITVLLAEDERRGEIVWLAQLPGQATPHGGILAISQATSRLLAQLRSSGMSATATPADVEPLKDLLPPQVAAAIETASSPLDEPSPPTDAAVLTVIPAGRLWHVPWACVPIARPPATTDADPASESGSLDPSVANGSARFLGETIPLTISPTLAYAGRSARVSGSPGQQPARHISWWRSSQVINHDARALKDSGTGTTQTIEELSSGSKARDSLLNATDHLTVLIAHGRPIAGTVHYLDLDDAIPLTPADMLEATPPQHLVLITCWGAASPQTRHGDPLSVVAVALAKGTQSAAATTSELLDDAMAGAFTNLFLDAALQQPLPHALHASTRRFLGRPDMREGYLSRWAPLVVIGH